MIVMNPQGIMPVGPWMLPAEFARPNWTTLRSGSAQQILEARGLLGSGEGYSGYGARGEPVPTRRVDVHTRENFQHYLNLLRVELANRGVTGAMSTFQERGTDTHGNPVINTHYMQRIGTREYSVAFTQVTETGSRSGGFIGWVEFEILDSLDRLRRREITQPARRAAARPSRTVTRRPVTRARRMSGLSMGRVASGARAYPRLPWRRYAGNVDLY